MVDEPMRRCVFLGIVWQLWLTCVIGDGSIADEVSDGHQNVGGAKPILSCADRKTKVGGWWCNGFVYVCMGSAKIQGKITGTVQD